MAVRQRNYTRTPLGSTYFVHLHGPVGIVFLGASIQTQTKGTLSPQNLCLDPQTPNPNSQTPHSEPEALFPSPYMKLPRPLNTKYSHYVAYWEI